MGGAGERGVWQPDGAAAPFDVVGLGESSLDHVAEIASLPAPGHKVRIAQYHRLPGGAIASAMLVCRRLGLTARYLGRVGADDTADEILGPLVAAGVDVAGVERVAGATSRLALVLVERSTGERTVLWHRDPRLALDAAALDARAVTSGRVLLLDAIDVDASTWAARRAREAGRAVVLDADADGPGMDALLETVSFPVISQSLAETRYGGPEPAVRALAAQSVLPVVTLGARGALACHDGELLESPAFAVRVRDTTGAGDVFHAAFTAGLLDGLGARALLRFANAAAGFSCAALGAQGALPDRAAVEKLLASGAAGA